MGSLVDEGFLLILGAGGLWLMSKAQDIPPIVGKAVYPPWLKSGIGVIDTLREAELHDLDDLLTTPGPGGSLSGIVHTSVNMPILGTIGTGPKIRKKRKVKYHNRFEDEDPSIGPMADHPVEQDPGEDTHGFSPSPMPDTTFQITAVGLFEDEDPSLGNYVEPMPISVQSQPREIASTHIPTHWFGMFEEDQFNT